MDYVKCMSSQLFATSFSCTLVLDFGSLHQKPLIQPEHCDLVSSVLPDASKFVVDFVEILTEVEIHGLLSDACTLDTCSVTDDLFEKVTCFVMNADTLTMLCRERDVEANNSFQRQFSPSCNFQNIVWKFVDSARSLVRNIFIFEVLVSFCVANAALVALSFSGLLSWTGVVFGPLLDIWNQLLCLLCWYSNNQNHRSKSGVCFRVQTSFLRVDGCCCNNVHVPTSFCWCEIQPVVLGDEKCQCVFFMMLPRERLVLCCKTVEHRS